LTSACIFAPGLAHPANHIDFSSRLTRIFYFTEYFSFRGSASGENLKRKILKIERIVSHARVWKIDPGASPEVSLFGNCPKM
jgi:hypothetical protein